MKTVLAIIAFIILAGGCRMVSTDDMREMIKEEVAAAQESKQ
jgi:hypothetical protein